MLGKTLGNFVITAPLGEGGMGEVFLAEHRRMGRKVAIKLLRPQYSVDPGAVERLFNEARATSMISHPGIVQIFDCDLFEGRAYLVMEFLAGQSLREHMNGWESPNLAHVVWLSSQIASVVQAAHEKSIVHRDLKPDNVFLVSSHEPHGAVQVKVLDFGIAKLRAAPTHGARLTGTGMLLGTPLYMSPEQCRGNGIVDERSDIYSLGCMMFEMLAGAPPFTSDASGELIAAHLYQPAPLLIDIVPQTPVWLCQLVGDMLSKDPGQRPQTMAQVEQALTQSSHADAPQAKVNVGQTLMLPSAQLPVSRQPFSGNHTTLSAAAQASTFSIKTNKKRWWLSLGLAALSAAGLILWALALAPTSRQPSALTAAQPGPTPGIAPPLPVHTAKTDSETAPPTSPDAGLAAPERAPVTPPVVPPVAPAAAPATRTKRTANKHFRGFDEL